MAEVTPIRPRLPATPWILVTIEPGCSGPGYDVCAWTGLPTAPGVNRMYCGTRPSLADEATFAHAKAAQLGAKEIVDFTDIAPDPDDAA